MNKLHILILAMLLNVTLFGCARPVARETITPTTPQQLVDTRWRLVKYQAGNQEFPFDSGAAYYSAGSIHFSGEGDVTGSDGCNSFKGKFRAMAKRQMIINRTFSTVVGCLTVSIELENGEMVTYDIVPNREDVWFRNALDSVIEYEVRESSLRLYFTNRSFQPLSLSRLLDGPRLGFDSQSYYMEFAAQPTVSLPLIEARGKDWQGIPALRLCAPTQTLKHVAEQDC